jgi:hypothetical protein
VLSCAALAGRGHTYESTLPIEEQVKVTLPPAKATSGNWLLAQKWKTERITELEQQVEALLAVNATQARTIEALRARVAELEAAQLTAAEEIMSYVESTPILKEAAHAKRLEENPEWALILGLGYNDTQRRNLIYIHLGKLLDRLRQITGGDATKAKQLSDLLYLRTHAGERRAQRERDNVEKIVEHRRDVAEGIAESLRSFVHALHEAGGKGRYPDKIRQAQQVWGANTRSEPPVSRLQRAFSRKNHTFCYR